MRLLSAPEITALANMDNQKNVLALRPLTASPEHMVQWSTQKTRFGVEVTTQPITPHPDG